VTIHEKEFEMHEVVSKNKTLLKQIVPADMQIDDLTLVAQKQFH